MTGTRNLKVWLTMCCVILVVFVVIQTTLGQTKFKAYNPSPADGATGVTMGWLEWKAGDTAAYHDVYFGTNPNPGLAEFKGRQVGNYHYVSTPLTAGTTYYWRIDEVEADKTTIHTGDVWRFSSAPLTAWDPTPPDGATNVMPAVDLKWRAGMGATKHHLYFGDSLTDVDSGTGGTDKGELGVAETTYHTGPLYPETTYYWRVDEYSGTMWLKGTIWSFTTSGPQTHYVIPGQSIQAAINAASNGDQIEVAPGTYYERIDFKGKAIRLYSSGGAAVTTINGGGIDGGSTTPVVGCASGEGSDTILEGFTVTGGYSTGWAGGMGNFGTSPTVINCTFTGNVAEWGGAGMWNGYASPTVTGCTFSDNSGTWGGGMCNYYGSPTVTNCTFSDNSAGWGGGMFNWTDSHPIVTDCTFSGNTTTGNGGGLENDDNSNATLTNCAFTGNSAGYQGGGMNNWRSNPTVTNCSFIGNTANNSGGGINDAESSPTVTNCNFSANSAGTHGGGISNKDYSSPTVMHCAFTDNSAIGSRSSGGGMTNSNYCSPIVSGCTFSSNTGSWAGGGMHNQYNSSPTITNCTFSANSTDIGGGGLSNVHNSSPTLTQCAFNGNSAGHNGGGMDNYNGSNALVTNCIFSGNSADHNGGGLGNWQSICCVTNCTFAGNSASDDGGGVCTDSSCTVANCIFWSNSGGEILGPASVTYSNVQGGFSGEGNIDADPLFGSGSLALTIGSPCIDTGDNGVVTGDHDLAGNPRIVDGNGDGVAVVDMGAYEFQPDPADAPTPTGEDVCVEPQDPSTGETPVTITFATVEESGFTSLDAPATPSHEAPANFKFGTPPTYYDISTTATYTGQITICVSYDPSTFSGSPKRLRLFHYEDDQWVDCTTSVDTINHVICGTVSSLSPFAVLEPVVIYVQIDIKPGSSPNAINPGSNGLVPVAVLSSEDFDATQVDPTTVTLAGANVAVRGKGNYMAHKEDVNGDGYIDLVVQVETSAGSAVWETGTAILTGNLLPEFGATLIEGSDEIIIVPPE
jgi:hypothetical protein